MKFPSRNLNYDPCEVTTAPRVRGGQISSSFAIA